MYNQWCDITEDMLPFNVYYTWIKKKRTILICIKKNIIQASVSKSRSPTTLIGPVVGEPGREALSLPLVPKTARWPVGCIFGCVGLFCRSWAPTVNRYK